ncbi:MAG: conjugal transfer protein TraG N-terminal domain-containing protein, partial [Gammaproteobacteria bacterium]|nr:conjugal transfer protein TraG N-terminal domain-containing protein [Gammaproteobacteria bacterium]
GPRALASSIVYMAGSFATVLMVMVMVAKQELLPTAKWFFGSLIITSALMLPKVDIIVKDRVTKLERPVAHVPFMLGVFAGVSSQLGEVLAKQMDAIFAQAGPDYTGHGVAMASKLLSKVEHFHIRDPLMAANMRGFVQQCMVFDIAKGKYTIKELHGSDNVWKLLRDTASKARGFVYKAHEPTKPKPVTSKIVTCEEGAILLEQAWSAAYKQAAFAYGSRLYPSAPNPAKLFMENLPLAHGYLTRLSHTAEEILQQSMMSNAIDDGLLELNQLTDANAAVTAYAAKRAQAQQRVAYSLQGSMASLSLSVLKVVVEILFYGLFPIIVAISIFPGGWVVIKKYIIALFWIQSWAPMYAILNMIMNIYGKTKSMAAVSTIGRRALNMYSLKGLSDANEWISSAAGYAMMSVPFLSYGIIHYGAGALSQLATHFGSVTQSAASHAAEEATTGNYSMGNTSFDNHNKHNVSGFKQDINASVATGRTTFQREDGSLLSTNRDGNPVLDRTPSISNLGASFNKNDSLQLGFSKMAEQSHRAGMQHMTGYQDNVCSALSKFQAMQDNHRQGKDSSESFVHGDAVYKDSALATVSAASKDLSEKLHIDRTVANQLLVGGNAGLNAGMGVGKNGKGVNAGASVGVSLGGSHDEKTSNSETQDAIQTISEKYDLQNALKKAESDTKEGRYSVVDSEGKSFDSGIRANLDKAFSHQKSAQASFSQEQAYREAAQLASNQGVDSSQNLSNEILRKQIEEHGLEGGVKNVSEPGVLNAIRKEFVDSEKPRLEQNFESHETYVSPEQLADQYREDGRILQENNNPTKYFETNQQNITEMAEKENLTKTVTSDLPDQFMHTMQETEQKIQDKQQEFSEQREKAEKNHEQFKEDSYVTDYGKKMDGILKSITGKGKRTNTNIKEVSGDKE